MICDIIKHIKGNFMKKVFIVGLIFGAFSAYANESINGYVQDHYKTVTRKVPVTQQYCQDVQIPIQGSRSDGKAGGVILGGLVGNALGAAVGVDGGRTLGTVIGMVAGNEMSREDRVEGYRVERRCNDTVSYETRSETVYSHSTVQFNSNGRVYTLTFKK
jgi:uncharacterized protein YcfJ